MVLDKTELKNVQKAIDVEIKHQYIDLKGKKSTFSVYISTLAQNCYRIPPKDKRWADLAILFKKYTLLSIGERIQAIDRLKALLKEADDAAKATKVNNLKLSKTQKDSEKKEFKNSDSPEETDVQFVKGVGPVLVNKLNSVHIFTAYDLLTYYPRDHIDFREQTKIADIEVGQNVTVCGTIKRVNSFNSRRNPKLAITTIHVYDGSGTITASWFMKRANKYVFDRYKDQFPKGAQVLLSGKVKFDKYTQKNSIDKPEIQVIYESVDDVESLHAARIVPVYSLTEGLSVKVLRRAINNAIETYIDKVEETMPPEVLQKYNLIDKQTAIKNIHFPEEPEQIIEAKKRLIFEEFFMHQLHLAFLRKSVKSNDASLQIKPKEGGLVEKLLESLPFTLTNAQQECLKDILEDLESTEPMHRLLQGDVGSGKTVVACLGLLAAVDNGYQGAIMAPTEVLAEQHYNKFVEWLTPLGVRIGLFLGKHGVKQRREMRQNLENGLTNIAVGTHALVQEGVVFDNLGLAVVDEQHRFGVKQRTKLKNKGINPEFLTMTATPIPRTLALSMHGDLDVSTIDEMPPGRKPVRTIVLGPAQRVRAYRLIEEEIKKGKQAFIVFPLIEESEKLAAKAATAEAEKLQKTVFKDYSVGLVHGKLKPVDKEKVMEEFRKQKYDILVSTTVIEVGVDVPNATVMVIENADRFGLAQLHQLRGRVGRSSDQAYCMLITNSNSAECKKRLSIMEQTNNGFVIAEYDLKLRGPGEFIGTKQSGVPDFILANLLDHADILEMAREAAFEMVKSEESEYYKKLLSRFSANYSETFDLLGSG